MSAPPQGPSSGTLHSALPEPMRALDMVGECGQPLWMAPEADGHTLLWRAGARVLAPSLAVPHQALHLPLPALRPCWHFRGSRRLGPACGQATQSPEQP